MADTSMVARAGTIRRSPRSQAAMGADGGSAPARSWWSGLRRNRRFDEQPTERAAVLLASFGVPFSKAALRQALSLSDGGAVAVVTIARLYGSQFGLPNPGLLPTQKELAEQQDQVNKAIGAMRKAGREVFGQVAISRHPVRTVASVAKTRGVEHVVLCVPEDGPRWRQLIEGNPARDLQRRLGAAITVHPSRVTSR